MVVLVLVVIVVVVVVVVILLAVVVIVIIVRVGVIVVVVVAVACKSSELDIDLSNLIKLFSEQYAIFDYMDKQNKAKYNSSCSCSRLDFPSPPRPALPARIKYDCCLRCLYLEV